MSINQSINRRYRFRKNPMLNLHQQRELEQGASSAFSQLARTRFAKNMQSTLSQKCSYTLGAPRTLATIYPNKVFVAMYDNHENRRCKGQHSGQEIKLWPERMEVCRSCSSRTSAVLSRTPQHVNTGMKPRERTSSGPCKSAESESETECDRFENLPNILFTITLSLSL
jgi:hypothetical protein